MCRAYPAGTLALFALPERERIALYQKTLLAYPQGLSESQVLQEPLTYLLAVLCEPALPGGNTIQSPSEILAALGLAATRSHPQPHLYVWGILRNIAYQSDLRKKRGAAFEAELPMRQTAEEKALAVERWRLLPQAEKEILVLSLDYSIKELALLWKDNYENTKKKVWRAKALLRKIFSEY